MMTSRCLQWARPPITWPLFLVRLQHSASVPPCRPTPGCTVGVFLERGKWISLIPSLFNKLIKLCVLHPEAILKWLSHSSVMLLIDGGRKGAQEGGTMKEGTAERCWDGEWRRDKLDRAETVVCNKIPTVLFLDGQSWEGAQADRLVWPASSSAAPDLITLHSLLFFGSTTRGRCLQVWRWTVWLNKTFSFSPSSLLFSLLLIWMSGTVWHMSLTYLGAFSVKICNSRITICQSWLRFNESQTFLQSWPQGEACLPVAVETETEHCPHFIQSEDKLSAMRWEHCRPDYDFVGFAFLAWPWLLAALCRFYTSSLTLWNTSSPSLFPEYTELDSLSSGDTKTTPDQPQTLVSQLHICERPKACRP